jgi:hypothetical protein
MAGTRVLTAVALTSGTPTPVVTGAVTAAVSFSITNNVATIVMGSLPTAGYNPGSQFNGFSGQAGNVGGDQVTLWGFTTATYFNGCTVTVIANNPALFSFSFNFSHANVGSTADAGSTAISPREGGYRSVRLEVDQTTGGSNKVYVGDLNVSSSRYAECLTLAGQIAVTISSGTIPAERIFCDTSSTGTKVQVSLMY